MFPPCGRVFIVAVLASTVTCNIALGNEILNAFSEDGLPADVDDSLEYSPKIDQGKAPESSLERLQRELEDDRPAIAGGEAGGQGRRKRFWSASESGSQEEEADASGYAGALDALLAYHEAVQREGRRVVDMPDMRREASEKLLFFTVTTRMAVSRVRLRVPASLRRASRVTADTQPDGAVDMSCNVRLGDFETWGKYDVKVNGVGPSGDFETTIRDRVVHATIRFRELSAVPTTAAAVKTATTATTTTTTTTTPVEARAESLTTPPPSLCSLEATELTLVERGRDDVPAVLSRWASQVEDVPTTLRVMKQLLNERLSHFPCGDDFVAMVRRGYAAPS